jgi:hypothetical protein
MNYTNPPLYSRRTKRCLLLWWTQLLWTLGERECLFRYCLRGSRFRELRDSVWLTDDEKWGRGHFPVLFFAILCTSLIYTFNADTNMLWNLGNIVGRVSSRPQLDGPGFGDDRNRSYCLQFRTIGGVHRGSYSRGTVGEAERPCSKPRTSN